MRAEDSLESSKGSRRVHDVRAARTLSKSGLHQKRIDDFCSDTWERLAIMIVEQDNGPSAIKK